MVPKPGSGLLLVKFVFFYFCRHSHFYDLIPHSFFFVLRSLFFSSNFSLRVILRTSAPNSLPLSFLLHSIIFFYNYIYRPYSFSSSVRFIWFSTYDALSYYYELISNSLRPLYGLFTNSLRTLYELITNSLRTLYELFTNSLRTPHELLTIFSHLFYLFIIYFIFFIEGLLILLTSYYQSVHISYRRSRSFRNSSIRSLCNRDHFFFIFSRLLLSIYSAGWDCGAPPAPGRIWLLANLPCATRVPTQRSEITYEHGYRLGFLNDTMSLLVIISMSFFIDDMWFDSKSIQKIFHTRIWDSLTADRWKCSTSIYWSKRND